VVGIIDHLSPEFVSKSCMVEHASCEFYECVVASFSYPIVFQGVWSGVFVFDSKFVEKLLELFADVLSPVVGT
jgi:hypothetical protein